MQPQHHDSESEPVWGPLGEAASAALVAALSCALPTAYRSAALGGSAADGLLIGAALLASLLLPIMLLIPKAARGLRGVAGTPPPRSLAPALGLWLGAAALLLALLAALLKAKTNHRGLGGATFGILGAGAVCAAAVLAGRVTGVSRRQLERGRPSRLLTVAALGAALAGAVVLVGPLVTEGSSATISAALFDLLLTVSVVAFVSTRSSSLLSSLGPRARLGSLVLLAAIVVGGFVRVEMSHAGATLQRGGGLPATLLGALERWSDRDGDGKGAHFGGHDCDEGDPRRHPGAAERAGDGLDADCDGLDHPAVAQPEAPAELASASRPARATTPASAPASQAAPEPEPPAKPDLILVTLDTVGSRHCSAYGYERPTTPALARLAERGMLFEHAYAAGSNTQRALMAVVSGNTMSATPTGGGEWPHLDQVAVTLAERFKQAGYQTGAVTSFTWLRKDLGFDQGFDHFDESAFRENHPERMVTGALATDNARALYDRLAKSPSPLYLWVHYFDAHQRYLEHEGIDFGEAAKDRYDGEVAFVDKQLGALLSHVDKGPRADRTLWVVHGSHGEAFGEHDKSGHGGTLIYDEVLRVPLVMAGPAVERGRFARAAVSTLDIAPTLLEAAGADAEGLPGVSLMPVLKGEAAFEHAPVMAYATHRTAVIDWPHKLLVRRRKDKRDRTLLFDLAADPGETKDLSADKPAEVERLNALRKGED